MFYIINCYMCNEGGVFALYKIKNIPEYSTLSELAFILNKDSFLNIVDYLGGLTIRIPTSKELLVIVNALLLYQYHNIENIDFDKASDIVDLYLEKKIIYLYMIWQIN